MYVCVECKEIVICIAVVHKFYGEVDVTNKTFYVAYCLTCLFPHCFSTNPHQLHPLVEK